MIVNLTAEQLRIVKDGVAVRLPMPEFAMECVLVRADLYDQVRSVVGDDVQEVDVAEMVESSMREYDDKDPLLESYQQYRQA